MINVVECYVEVDKVCCLGVGYDFGLCYVCGVLCVNFVLEFKLCVWLVVFVDFVYLIELYYND